MIQMPVDPELHKAACKIAVKCRHVIQGLLRDEEIADADMEFYQVAMEIMKELSAFKAGGK